ncbi:Proline iminopeptidase [Pelotomaculum schinkii]|uniref:prolyl aminopeptidase n=1 Tax=Pelotomaculum schinkii TaxID=78350 RepID=A0A4Y7RFP0_9FIRM|nr:alpha/beta hydrolase [Pelotomaculum schinkii]TEB07804.1 Proline iminopeptidase [Pelotomaculum schinkii]
MMLSKKAIIFGIIIIIFIAVFIWKQVFAWTPKIRDDKGSIKPNSIASLEKTKIGGMDQWILLRGNDISNPVLLWLHGGPGAPLMPVARHYNGALESEFIIVQWDQRGAGKSNPLDFDEQTMTFEQFCGDTHELTQYLKKRFNKEKIYLVGHSWGTQIGSKVAYDYPNDYYAYIAVSQVVDPSIGNEIAHTWLQKEIDLSGNQAHLKRLKDLGTPPYTEHEDFVSFIKMVDSYGGGMDIGMDKLALIALKSPEYRLSDYYSWLKGANRGSGPMWKSSLSFNVFQQSPRFLMPVYFFNGVKDYNTPLELVEKYYEVLDAPKGKYLVRFENSAHAPFMQEAEKFNNELVRTKKETYKK